MDDNNPEMQEDWSEDDYSDDDENEICGYECLCCGTSFGEDECDGMDCPVCMSSAVDPIYF